jgi:hypothetical protein
MRTLITLPTCVLVLSATSAFSGQLPAQAVRIVDRNAHHRTWEAVQEIRAADGRLRLQTNSYVELQGGMHRLSEEGWVETDPKIEQFQDGAVIRNLQYGAIFAPNLATPNAIDLSLPGGGRVQGHLLGLALTEENKSVLIAEVKDCAGVIGGPEQNELTFADAMTDFAVSVKYIAQRDRLSQVVLLERQLPHPSEWGLTENAVLEVLTEFTAFPEMRKQAREPINGIPGEHLSFASMEFVTGKAFSIGDEANAVSVQKKMELFEGHRWFLVEKVPWKAVAPELAKLPPVAKNWRENDRPLMARDQLRLPKRQQARAAIKPIQMAAAAGGRGASVLAASGKPAYVLDWELVSSVNSNLWRADTTYYIAGAVTIKTNIFEGGVVIKFAPTNNAKLTITGPVTCLSTNYAPIIMTARDDHTIGGTIGAAALSGYYANTAMELDYSASGVLYDLHDIRISHATTAIVLTQGRGHTARNIQLVKCGKGISGYNPSFYVLNGLFHDVGSAFWMSPSSSANTGMVQHATFNQCDHLDSSGLLTLFGTNNLFVAVTNMASFTGAYNGTNSDPGAALQIVGGGANYLANGSAFRDAGTTNIDASLLAGLQKTTTYPPSVVSNTISINTNFSINVARDTNAPDIGYHYDPIDYAMGSVIVTNASLTLTNGVAIGTFTDIGIVIYNGAQIASQGTPDKRNQICRYNTVQEQSTNWGTTNGMSCFQVYGYEWASTAPMGRFRFTDFRTYANGGYHLYTYDSLFRFNSLVVRDCDFNAGKLHIAGSAASRIGLTNNLFHRNDIYFSHYTGLNAYNNLFKGSICLFEKHSSTNAWVFKNNSFDGASIQDDSLESITHGNNAYISCNTNLNPLGGGDIVTNSFEYDAGPLGRFYQPTNSALVNTGSTNSAAAGLYHYTTATNQTVEGNTTVDIGLHYVAVDAFGAPLDSDYDGIPDYVADPSGNGIVEPTEIANLKLWLNGTVGVTTNASGQISTWADQSGNGCDAVQSSANLKPLLSTNVINSLPVVSFYTTNDFTFSTSPFVSATQAEMMIVLKARADVPAGHRALGYFGIGHTYYPLSGGNIQESFGSTTSTRNLGEPAQALDQFHIYDVLSASNVWAARLNGLLQYQATDNEVTFPSAPRLGSANGSSRWDGDIAEVLIYSRPLTTQERGALGNYLAGKYALASAPAAPGSLVAKAISSNQVSLAWSATLTNVAASFIVERKTSGGIYAMIAVVENGASHIDTGLAAATQYYYRVKARNYGGDSDYSNETNATTLTDVVSMPLSELVLWLKADAGRGAPNLSIWADQSGKGNHAVQVTSANRPEAVNGVVNGRAVVRFDSVNDQFSFQNNPFSGMTQGEALFVLKADVDVPGGNRGLGYFGTNNTYYPLSSGNIQESFGSTNGTRNIGNPVQPLDQFHIYDVLSAPSAWAARLNGVLQYQATTNAVIFPSAPRLGSANGSSPWDGDLAEVLFYNRTLTDEERDAAGRYLTHKYAVIDPPAVPAGLLATGVSGTALNLTWTNTISTAGVLYQVERKMGAGGSYSKVGTARNSSSFLDSNAPSATNFYYRILAENYNTTSAYSAAVAPPFVAITNAQSGDTLISETNRYLIADAQDSDGSVTQVVFYALSSAADTLTNAPYSLQLSKVLSGYTAITVKAWDNAGNTRIGDVNVILSYDSDGDGVADFTEIVNGTNLHLVDTDGDGVSDLTDAFPLDPGRWSMPSPDPGDTTPPTITIDEPAEATPVP